MRPCREVTEVNEKKLSSRQSGEGRRTGTGTSHAGQAGVACFSSLISTAQSERSFCVQPQPLSFHTPAYAIPCSASTMLWLPLEQAPKSRWLATLLANIRQCPDDTSRPLDAPERVPIGHLQRLHSMLRARSAKVSPPAAYGCIVSALARAHRHRGQARTARVREMSTRVG